MNSEIGDPPDKGFPRNRGMHGRDLIDFHAVYGVSVVLILLDYEAWTGVFVENACLWGDCSLHSDVPAA